MVRAVVQGAGIPGPQRNSLPLVQRGRTGGQRLLDAASLSTADILVVITPESQSLSQPSWARRSTAPRTGCVQVVTADDRASHPAIVSPPIRVFDLDGNRGSERAVNRDVAAIAAGMCRPHGSYDHSTVGVGTHVGVAVIEAEPS